MSGPVRLRARSASVRIGIAVALLALLGATPKAFADWIKMAGNDSVDAYMDLKLLENKGDYVLSWRLFDYRKPQKTLAGKTFLSAATLVATRCASRTEVMLSFKQYDGPMGKGSVVESRDIPKAEWEVNKIAPGSIGEALNKVACQRFKLW